MKAMTKQGKIVIGIITIVIIVAIIVFIANTIPLGMTFNSEREMINFLNGTWAQGELHNGIWIENPYSRMSYIFKDDKLIYVTDIKNVMLGATRDVEYKYKRGFLVSVIGRDRIIVEKNGLLKSFFVGKGIYKKKSDLTDIIDYKLADNE